MTVRVRYFPAYGGMPAATKAAVQRLGMPGGVMRTRAIRYPCAVTIASFGSIIVGWATCHPKRSWNNPGAWLQCYVSPHWRRTGIGTRLIDRLMDEQDLWGGKMVMVCEASRRGEAFWAKAI